MRLHLEPDLSLEKQVSPGGLFHLRVFQWLFSPEVHFHLMF